MAISNVVIFSLAPDLFGAEKAIETSAVLYLSYGSGFLLGSLVGKSSNNFKATLSRLIYSNAYFEWNICLPVQLISTVFLRPKGGIISWLGIYEVNLIRACCAYILILTEHPTISSNKLV